MSLPGHCCHYYYLSKPEWRATVPGQRGFCLLSAALTFLALLLITGGGCNCVLNGWKKKKKINNVIAYLKFIGPNNHDFSSLHTHDLWPLMSISYIYTSTHFAKRNLSLLGATTFPLSTLATLPPSTITLWGSSTASTLADWEDKKGAPPGERGDRYLRSYIAMAKGGIWILLTDLEQYMQWKDLLRKVCQ